MASFVDSSEGDIVKSAKYKWQLGHRLGRGTCSVVVEAVGTFCSKKKCRHPQVIKGAAKIFKQGHRFELAATNEIENLHYLRRQHESPYRHYIVQLLDYFLYRDQLHLVYERLDCNLHHILLKNSGKGLPLSIIKRCSWDVVRALCFLATNRVVHGDLKMSNIMWNPNRGMFQLVDFGLSFLEGQQPHQPLQSPGYQSPEAQVWNRLVAAGTADRNNSRCCFASDMWSFWYVLWYMYTGTPAPRCQTDEPVCVMCLQEEDYNCCGIQTGVTSICQCFEDAKCIHFKQIKKELPVDDRKITPEQHELFLDFVMRMIKCKPEQRMTPFNAMQHAFLNSRCTPLSLTELLLLPTRILQLTNIHLEDLSTDSLLDGVMDVKEECAKFGVVRSCKFDGDLTAGYKVFVEFSDADDCLRAHSALTGREYDGRTVITSFYPIDCYYTDYFWR
ncbi:serine/threonine-protein kinase Kist-like isoform X1 [Oculina patagonica]